MRGATSAVTSFFSQTLRQTDTACVLPDRGYTALYRRGYLGRDHVVLPGNVVFPTVNKDTMVSRHSDESLSLPFHLRRLEISHLVRRGWWHYVNHTSQRVDSICFLDGFTTGRMTKLATRSRVRANHWRTAI